jgi:hypothetical protein
VGPLVVGVLVVGVLVVGVLVVGVLVVGPLVVGVLVVGVLVVGVLDVAEQAPSGPASTRAPSTSPSRRAGGAPLVPGVACVRRVVSPTPVRLARQGMGRTASRTRRGLLLSP